MKHLIDQERLLGSQGARTGIASVTVLGASLGFRPAFLDFATQTLHPSCYASGEPAPFHTYEGLPEGAIADRLASGRAVAAKVTVIAGFERNGFFYSPASVARAIADWR